MILKGKMIDFNSKFFVIFLENEDENL